MSERPIRVQLQRTKGWRIPANTVVVARPRRWGNPHRANLFGNDLAVRLFRRDMETGGFGPITDIRTVEHARSELAGKNLACWCPIGVPCHADVLLELANSPPPPAGADDGIA